MNIFRPKNIVLFTLIFGTQYTYAGSLSGDQVSLDLLQLSRDSGKSITYLYDNGGTVNSPADDTPVGNTNSFSDTADLGYSFSATKALSGKWSVNAGLSNNEMNVSKSFSDSSNRLEIFRNPITSQFDSAHLVNSNYQSKFSSEEINGVYNYNKLLDFMFGIGHINLKEKFKITSYDTSAGTYTINTDNNMMGVNAGINYNTDLSSTIGFYLFGKIGWYNNKTKQNQHLNDTSITRNNSGSDSSSSILSDLSLGINYYFTKHLTANLGYQEINITNVALAESQFNTTTSGSNAVIGSDDIKWSGFNLGLTYIF